MEHVEDDRAIPHEVDDEVQRKLSRLRVDGLTRLLVEVRRKTDGHSVNVSV